MFTRKRIKGRTPGQTQRNQETALKITKASMKTMLAAFLAAKISSELAGPEHIATQCALVTGTVTTGLTATAGLCSQTRLKMSRLLPAGAALGLGAYFGAKSMLQDPLSHQPVDPHPTIEITASPKETPLLYKVELG